MINDSDREFARTQAGLIYENHVANGIEHVERNHVSSNISYVETTLRRGILAECAFANIFGVPVSQEINHFGDAGADFRINLKTDVGVRQFAVDVKSKSVRTTWDALRKSGTHLRVLKREIRPLTVYVFGIYLERTDDASVLAWQWGSVLADKGELRLFENCTRDDSWCYAMPFEDLRPLEELADRLHIHDDADRLMA